MRPRSLFFSLVLLVAVGGLVPVLADSVFVRSDASDVRSLPGIQFLGTSIFDCQQAGTASASCTTAFQSNSPQYGFLGGGGTSSGTAAFGKLSGHVDANRASGQAVASFGDDVVVTGGSGSGTLVAHYYLVSAGEAQIGAPANFAFVQGSTKAGVVPTYTLFGVPPVPPPSVPPGCEYVGFCFSEGFDVTSSVQFGVALPLGAELSLGTPSGTLIPPNGDVTANASLDLTGYTVLDGAGNVIAEASVTQQHVAGLDLFPAPEPGTWGLMLAALGVLGAWRLRGRVGLLLSVLGLLAVCGTVPVFADSLYVDVRNSSGFAGPPGLTPKEPYVPNCEQIGTSSATCSTVTSNTGFRDYGDSGTASASAAFGNVHTGFAEGPASDGTAVALSGDKVVVTGGSGSGTLVSHYYLISEGEAQLAGDAKFSFVQDSTRTDVSANYQYFGPTPVQQPSVPPGCEYVGYCFSEAFDVSSPVQFGTAILLGARLDARSSSGTLIPPSGGTTAYASIMLNGYTVLDASGNIIADASVTQQHAADLDLFPAPEPGTWGLMLAALGVSGAWRLRRNKRSGW